MSHVLRAGVTDQIAYFRAYNTDGSAKTDLTSSTTGLSLSVFRVGASSVSISSLSNKAADDTTHADGAIRNVGGNLYTIDIPDAATATQVPSIVVRGTYTGGVIEGLEHPIVAYDPSLAYQQQLWAAANSTVNLSGTTVKAVTDRVTANTDQIAGASVSTSTAQLGVNVVQAGGTAWGSGAITAAAIASNAITSAKIATDAIGSAQLAASAVGEIADGVWDEPYAGHTTAGSFGKLLDTIRKANLTIDGTVSNAITPTTLTFSSNVVATTSAYAHAVLLFVSGPLAGENSPIISYNSTNGVFVLEEPLTAAPSNGDEFVVIAGSHVHDVASIQSGLATTTQLTTVEGKIDAIDGVTDKLDTTLELDGSVYRFTANALEQAPSGGGGGSSTVVVTPLVAQTPVRAVGTNIETFIGDLSDIDVSIFSGEDPVDLSALGNLEVCVQAKNGVDLDLVEMADLTISGTSNETISWTPNGPSVSDVGRFKWSLRIASTKQVIAYGAWIVIDAALSDAS